MSLIFTIRNDSIKLLINKRNYKEAKEHICLVYKNCNKENVDDYLNYLKSISGSDSSKLTIKDALCNPMYRRATWINVGYIVFHELTGANPIIQYSNEILT